MNNNDKIKEAFEKWRENELEETEYQLGKQFQKRDDIISAWGFAGGYTSRDEEVAMLKTVIEQAGSNGMALLAEIEQLKKDKSDLLEAFIDAKNDTEIRLNTMRSRADITFASVIPILREKIERFDSLIERMKG